MDAKLMKALDEALTAAEAMASEIESPEHNARDAWLKVFKPAITKIKAGRKALDKARA